MKKKIAFQIFKRYFAVAFMTQIDNCLGSKIVHYDRPRRFRASVLKGARKNDVKKMDAVLISIAQR